MSKQVHPRDYGESRDGPVRSLLLLRGWALWRANVTGWRDEKPCRQAHFAEHEAKLERDIKALGSTDKLLGNKRANCELRTMNVALYTRLLRPR